MKRGSPTGLARALHRFFQEYLSAQRGLSLHTLRSYRDAVLLFLRYAAQDTRRRIESLELDDFTSERVTRFLCHLETDRNNGITTRNARLAALHTFARFLIELYPERMADYQRVLGIPVKRGAQRVPIDYLELSEVEALLGNVNQTTPTGRRDYALFALMFNTGARVQEILNLKVRDVRFDPPHQVRLLGKGNKVRLCPIWPRTAKLLQELTASTPSTTDDPTDRYVFQNRRGEPLTRFGVRYLLRKHLPKRLAGGSSGLSKQLHPHSLRHTTAVYLLKSGVEVATISQWLGHTKLNTTMRYARADMDLKRQALSQVFPETLGVPKGGRVRLDGTEITAWLKRL
jgi:integrase/recombinase XerD